MPNPSHVNDVIQKLSWLSKQLFSVAFSNRFALMPSKNYKKHNAASIPWLNLFTNV